MRFKNLSLQSEFEKKGFLVMDFLEEPDIEALRKIYTKYPAKQVASFQVSNYEKDPGKNREIDQAIKNIIAEKISQHLEGYKLLSGFFYVKFPGKDSAFYIHKDWNVVDESRFTSLHIWIPLQDTTPENGNLFVCPFDYKKKQSFRGSPGFEEPEPGFMVNIINRFYQKDIYTRLGQAICFDHRMTHGSRTNQTGHVRVAAGISLIPAEAQMVHYHKHENGRIEQLQINEDFYLDFDLDNPNGKSL